MRTHTLPVIGVVGLAALVASVTAAAASGSAPAAELPPSSWAVDTGRAPVASLLTGGPWTVNQANATYANPLGDPNSAARFCILAANQTTGGTITDHIHDNGASTPSSVPATDVMEPFYFPVITANDGLGHLTGIFDWRPKDNDEAIVEATSSDYGATWTAVPNSVGAADVLRYRDTCISPANGDDDGQGHGNVITVGGHSFLYTIDRSGASGDQLGLLVHNVGEHGDLTGLPQDERLGGVTYGNSNNAADPSGPFTSGTGAAGPAYRGRTVGLINPDGILGVVPQADRDPSRGVEVMYLEKDLNFYTGQTGTCPSGSADKAQTGKKENQDRTTLRLAETTDGINFVDRGPVQIDGFDNTSTDTASATRFIGPNGTVLRYHDGSYGLFFSGGNCVDGDSDAYHYVGYAHSVGSDFRHLVIDRGFTNPIYSVDYTFPQADNNRTYYTGRVYAPQLVPTTDGSHGILLFSGYQYPKPTTITSGSEAPTGTEKYRAIMTVPMTLSGPAVDLSHQPNTTPCPPAHQEIHDYACVNPHHG